MTQETAFVVLIFHNSNRFGLWAQMILFDETGWSRRKVMEPEDVEELQKFAQARKVHSVESSTPRTSRFESSTPRTSRFSASLSEGDAMFFKLRWF